MRTLPKISITSSTATCTSKKARPSFSELHKTRLLKAEMPYINTIESSEYYQWLQTRLKRPRTAANQHVQLLSMSLCPPHRVASYLLPMQRATSTLLELATNNKAHFTKLTIRACLTLHPKCQTAPKPQPPLCFLGQPSYVESYNRYPAAQMVSIVTELQASVTPIGKTLHFPNKSIKFNLGVFGSPKHAFYNQS